MTADDPGPTGLDKLRQENRLYEALFRDVPFGWAYHEMVLDEDGKPVDYIFLKANSRFEQYTGLKAADIIGRRVTEIIPGIENAEPDLIKAYGEVALTGEPLEMEIYFAPFDRWYNVVANCPEKGYFNAIFEEVSARKKAEAELAAAMSELARSNKDLEQFAYVASHDLQEPLRMVSSYTELLGRRYSAKLDDEADRFIGYAVDGAQRMQILINDLLEFSRVGRLKPPAEPTELSEVAATVLDGLSDRVAERGAKVECGQLPAALIQPVHAKQVLQNLLTNALKFSAGTAPEISISGNREDGRVTLTVKDNGIGIAPEHHAKVFAIFQRLHKREKYPGTGIGLALVKRIIEHNGGTIRLESKEGEGTSFHVTMLAPEGGEA